MAQLPSLSPVKTESPPTGVISPTADSPRAAAARARTYTHIGQQSPLAAKSGTKRMGEDSPVDAPAPGGGVPDEHGELTEAQMRAACPFFTKEVTLTKAEDGSVGMGWAGGVVCHVAAEGPAQSAGIEIGQKIVMIGGESPAEGDEVDKFIAETIRDAGSEIRLTLETEVELNFNELFHSCCVTGKRPAARVNLGNMKGYTLEEAQKYAEQHPEHCIAVCPDISDYTECFWNYRYDRWCTPDEAEHFDRILEALYNSKGSFLTEPIADKTSETVRGFGLECASTTMQGWRTDNEDAHIAQCELQGRTDCSLFAVLDGHGGARVARWAATQLAGAIADALPTELSNGAVEKALYSAVLLVDDRIEKEMKADHCGTTGSTLNAVLVTATSLVTANVGDSRAVLATKQTVRNLSEDHKPTDEAERKRIEEAGSQVTDGRVDGMLAVSRALGDCDFKQAGSLPPERQAVSCAPDITVVERDKANDEFILQACDGIWDCKTSEEACDFIRKQLASGASPIAAVEALCDSCLAKDLEEHGLGSDNMTVNLIIFK